MINILILALSILGSSVTYYWSVKYKQSPVLTSAASSLITALLLYSVQGIFGEPTVKTLALAFFGGSFVGMSAEIVIKKMSYVMLSGLIFGLVYLVALPVFVGYGGGLGFRATFSVLIVLGVQFIEEKLTKA